MALQYNKLKSLSREELIERYDREAHMVPSSLSTYTLELNHRELCGLLMALLEELKSISCQLGTLSSDRNHDLNKDSGQ